MIMTLIHKYNTKNTVTLRSNSSVYRETHCVRSYFYQLNPFIGLLMLSNL